jgi:hypothetical protein
MLRIKLSPSNQKSPVIGLAVILPTQVLESDGTGPKLKEAADMEMTLLPEFKSLIVKDMEGIVAEQGKV